MIPQDLDRLPSANNDTPLLPDEEMQLLHLSVYDVYDEYKGPQIPLQLHSDTNLVKSDRTGL